MRCKSDPRLGNRVRKRGRHQAAYVDLPDPVPALPGKQGVAFDETQRTRTAA
jgi:hypothetical protein